MSQLILMAEDDPDIQLVDRLALKRGGYRVDVVANGRLLLERVAAERPDLILLDWMMPEMDGPETCARLKASPATADIPVIFLTGKAQAADVAQITAAGAVGSLAKPFDALGIGDDIKRLLAVRPGPG